MAATGILKRLGSSPLLIANTLTTGYTAPGSTKTRLKQINLMNDHSAAVNVDIHFVPSGGSASATNKMFKASSPNGMVLNPGETKIVFLDTVFETGEFVQFLATTTNVVSADLSGLEITGTSFYKRLWAPQLVGTGLTTMGAAVPGSKTWQVKEILLMNDHSAQVLLDIYGIPSGGSATATNKLFKGASPYGIALEAGETKIFSLENILPTGAFFQMQASVNNVVSVRASGLEI